MEKKLPTYSSSYRFQRPPAERAELERVFNAYVDEVLAKAEELRTERSKGYNSRVAVIDYFPHGEQDFVYELFKKLLRTENAIIAEAEGEDIDGRVEDGIIDGINYFTFLYAFYKMRREGLI